MSADWSHFFMSLGRSLVCTATLDAVGPEDKIDGLEPPHATSMRNAERPADESANIGPVAQQPRNGRTLKRKSCGAVPAAGATCLESSCAPLRSIRAPAAR